MEYLVYVCVFKSISWFRRVQFSSWDDGKTVKMLVLFDFVNIYNEYDLQFTIYSS